MSAEPNVVENSLADFGFRSKQAMPVLVLQNV